jgi:hypothetical protein
VSDGSTVSLYGSKLAFKYGKDTYAAHPGREGALVLIVHPFGADTQRQRN